MTNPDPDDDLFADVAGFIVECDLFLEKEHTTEKISQAFKKQENLRVVNSIKVTSTKTIKNEEIDIYIKKGKSKEKS